MTHGTATSAERTFPEFVPTGDDLKALAHHYLTTFFDIHTFEFCCGTYSPCQSLHAAHCFDRFNTLCELLGPDIRRKVIDDVERECRRTTDEDAWEAFKTTVKEGFFSKPPDHAAVIRLARSMDGRWDDAANHYSFEFVKVLKEALKREDARLSLTVKEVAPPVTPSADADGGLVSRPNNTPSTVAAEWGLKPGMEDKLRQRRIEILMAGSGDPEDDMSEEEATAIAMSETVDQILLMDAEHLCETDPDLFDDTDI